VRVTAAIESWPIARPFTTARGSKKTAEVVVATVTDGNVEGHGECVPYPRYGDDPAVVAAAINAFQGPFERRELLHALPAGPARNAIDCALWDLEAKLSGQPAWQLAGVSRPVEIPTAFTLPLDSPSAMGQQARLEQWRPLLKVKLGSDDVAADIERLRMVRTQAPGVGLIVDANEGWTPARLEALLPVADDVGVSMIEQPLPAGRDEALLGLDSPVPIGADESAHLPGGLPALRGKYQVVNIKLDKTGGLTTALAMARAARAQGFDVMIGCMVATSLAMAPALLLAGFARFVDLDGPLLLRKDREPGLNYRDSLIEWPNERIWGTPSSG